MLHIIYRLCIKDSKIDCRPTWYSKEKCFYNLQREISRISDYDFRVYVDGDFPDWLDTNKYLCAKTTKTGNAQSFWEAFLTAINLPKEHHVYFIEDDYVHAENSIVKLVDAIKSIELDFFTLYDHPDRYKNLPEHNLGETVVYKSNTHHWRTVPSTTMTFAARVSSLVEGYDLFNEWCNRDGNTVSWELFPRLLGLKGESSYRMSLIGAIPSLATHCENEHLAHFVDWEKEIENI